MKSTKLPPRIVFSAIGLHATFSAVLFVSGCSEKSGPASSAKEAPAKLEMVPHETELATLNLTDRAVKRLAIEVAPVVKQEVSRYRTLAGEAIVPPGRSIIAAAPVPGVIAAVDQFFPQPGTEVTAAQPVMILQPLLSPERDVPTPAEQVQMTGAKANLMVALVTAQGEVARSESEIEGLKITRDRAAKLLEDRAGSRRALDDAEALLGVARSVLEAAKQREKELIDLLKSLNNSNAEVQDDPASPLTLTAPVAGVIRNVQVSAGQTVTAAAPLFEVVDLSTIWIRVPVYVDLLSKVRRDQVVRLVSLDGTPLSSTPKLCKPIAAPPTADAASSSADLYYEFDNRELRLMPGQRIGIDMPMTGVAEALVVPSAAVLYDIYGGTWVYVQSSTNEEGSKFTRSRVLLEWVDGDKAILSKGPPVDTLVVTAGAAELFGTEFGAGK
ncbi:MAG: efflux RND transporter periplasmic adaptor subunit [Planctomycetes bacterium]|nr:efflux RND transporter periplasmic adaptor subunit [Planctomycetota bacterium]